MEPIDEALAMLLYQQCYRLLTLLIRITHNLKRLELGMAELLTESWEGVIECMTQSMHLLCFDIDPYTEFWLGGGTKLFLKHHPGLEDIKQYVGNGGRHPYLRSDQPDPAAQDYVTEDVKCFCTAVSSISES